MTDWREVRLGDLLKVKHGFAFSGRYFCEEGSLIVLTPGNFHERGGFKPKNGVEKFYDGPVPNGYLLAQGQVVIAMTEQAAGLLGSSATIPVGDVYLHNQRIGLIVENSAVACREFLYYLFNCSEVRMQISASATGSKVRHTAPERVHAVRVRVPDIRSQRRVAAAMSAFDQLIDSNRRRIEILEETARSLYREWFVERRFPGHESVDSRLDTSPRGWSRVALCVCVDVNPSSTNPAGWDEVRYLDISAVGERCVTWPTSIAGGDAPGRARRLVIDGDVIHAMVRPNRRAHARIVNPPPKAIVSTGLAVLRPRSVPSAFVYEVVSDQAFTDYLVGRATGAAYPAVKPSDFGDAVVVVPPRPLLEQFESAVDPLHRLASTLAAHSALLAAARDLLLPKLVTGAINVDSLRVDDVFGWAELAEESTAAR